MITCMIYISNDNESLDANVGIEIKLPCLPRIKDELFLTDEQISELEEMAKSDLKIAENYFPKYFYEGSHLDKEVTKENINNLSFQDVQKVKRVVFFSGDEAINIEIGKL